MASSASDLLPRDVQVIKSTMKELGINDFEEQVLKNLLESTYKYITFILDEANVYSNYAGKTHIDVDDVKVATKISKDGISFKPPERAILLKASNALNKIPLPPIKPACGLKIPVENLSQTNYKLKTNLIDQSTHKTILVTKTADQFFEQKKITGSEENVFK